MNFAETTFQGVRAGALGETLIIIAALAIIARILWEAADRVRGGSTQKREVSFAEIFATQKEHAELKAEVAKIDHERRTSAAQLHTKLDNMRSELDERINAIPGRTIALLNETRQLHHRDQ
jgi:hypothetical protein